MDGQQATLEEFLNPKSMLTPGVAGALTMLITNALSQNFGLWPNYTGLAISLLLGLVVFFSQSPGNWLARCVYYGLNSLIIFSVAMGVNQAGVAAGKATDPTPRQRVAEQKAPGQPFFANWLDGTVKRRAELVSDVHKLDDRTAKKTLSHLDVPVAGIQSPKNLVADIASAARTEADVNRVQAAIASASGSVSGQVGD